MEPTPLQYWMDLQIHYVELRNAYRVAWAQAYSTAEAKTDAAKKAAADIATSDLRLARDKAEVEAVAAWQAHLKERGPCEADRPAA